MKNLKYTLIVVAGLLYTVNVSAQESKTSFFESSAETAASPGTGGGGSDEVDVDPAPINDYLPLLLVGGLAVAFYNRKKLGLVKN